jgi:hypothetical protein
MQKRALSAQQSPLGIVQAGVSCLKREGLKLGKILIDENKSGPLVASLVFLLIVAVVFIRWRRKDKVFLLDFECFKTQKEKHVSYQRFEQGSRDSGFFTQEALDFQTRMLSKRFIRGNMLSDGLAQGSANFNNDVGSPGG